MASRRVKVVGALVGMTVGISALAAAGAVGLENTVWRDPLGSASTSPIQSAPTAVSSLPVPSTSPPPPVASLEPVLVPAGSAAESDPSAVARKVASAGNVPDARISAAVMSADSGRLLYSRNATTGLIPASVTKLLTTSAALKLLGPEHRFRTSVVQGTDSAGSPAPTRQIILVGGGDPYLAGTRKQIISPGQASLEALAASTAKRLKADKITSVRLGYDASLFSGPDWNPTWPSSYSLVVTRTSALWANEGQLYGSEGPRQPEPAEAAAGLFAALLQKKHIKVTSVTAARAAQDADEIAGIDSLPLDKIVERLLMVSDNDAAEVIARQVAIADGKPGTIADAVNSIKKTLTVLGVWTPGTRIYDGSGLSRAGRIPAEALVKVLRLSIGGSQPELAPVFTGLPVAGVEGSLHYRFSAGNAQLGRGLVRGKTGTLSDVHSVAGYAYTRDGELLIFAFVVNNAKNDKHEWNAVEWLDRVSAAVASCGCRG